MFDISRRELLAGSGAIGIAATLPAQAAVAAGPDAAATTMLAAIADRLVAEYPENASYYGIDKDARAALRGRLTDRSEARDRTRARWAGETLAALKRVDRTRLSPAVATDMDVAQEAFDLAVAGWHFPFGDMAVLSGQNSYRNAPFAITQLGGALVDVPDFLNTKHGVETASDAERYLARIEAYAGELASETDRFGADRERGVLPPDFLIDAMLDQRKAALADPVEKWTIVTTFRAKLAKAGLPDRYAADAAKLCASKVQTELQRQNHALQTARASAWSDPGVWKQPQGADYYDWALRAATTTRSSAAEIHAQGLEQVARLQGEMDVVLKAQGLTQGSVGARMMAIAKRPDTFFANDDAGRASLLAYLNGRIEDMRGRLPRAFETVVKGNLVIRRVPEAIENGAPNGYAYPGSIDGKLPGVYYINLRDTRLWPRYTLPSLCYHEGIPGHIWQGEYANALPLIRTHLLFNAYTEGWGLYAEQLGDELGAYDSDPLGRLGYLQSILFRACRMVVDTGVHAKRWTMQQALDFFETNLGVPGALVQSEVVRYCAIPGQACGYQVGHTQIVDLRRKAQAALGAKYDFRKFNDAVVLSGNVPLTLLGTIIDRHIAQRRG